MNTNTFLNIFCGNLTFSAVITSQIEWTLTVESARQINTCCSWCTRSLLTINNIVFTVFAGESIFEGKILVWVCLKQLRFEIWHLPWLTNAGVSLAFIDA